MTDTTIILETDLTTRFPERVVHDERKGYEGFIVNAENLIEVATFLRDEIGYDYLASLTGVDYLPDEKFEVVYLQMSELRGRSRDLFRRVRQNARLQELRGADRFHPMHPGWGQLIISCPWQRRVAVLF